MPGFFPDSFIDEVRERSDIIEIVSEYMPLQKKGKKHWGLCPFHGEKTASFSVDQQSQLYYCFGCHVGGNVFSFVREMEHMEFHEAVRHLAERARMDIPEGVQRFDGPKKDKDRLVEALTAAARLFNKTLYEPHGERALAYLHGRGIFDNTVKRYGLGVTPPGGEALTKALLEQGFEKQELIDANLSMERNGRIFDVFRNRVMFPIIDPRGKVIAFGGRVMGDEQPKYLNSSDTAVFNKRRNVYGLNFLKGKRFSALYLMEGYMDVVSLGQHGVDGCIATLGTALTAEQVRLIKKYNENVVICYDGDEAGQRATQRAISLFEEGGMEPRVLVVPNGMDPDDYVRAHGKEGFLSLRPIEVTAYRLNTTKQRYELSKEEDRASYAEDAALILKRLSPVQAERYIKRLSIETGYEIDTLRRQIGVSQVQGERKRHISPIRGENKLAPVHVLAQRQLIAYMASSGSAEMQKIAPELISDPTCKAMYEALTNGGMEKLNRLMDEAPQETRGEMAQILLTEVGDASKALKDSVESIERHLIETELTALKETMAGMSQADMTQALGRIQALTMRLARLKDAGRKE